MRLNVRLCVILKEKKSENQTIQKQKFKWSFFKIYKWILAGISVLLLSHFLIFLWWIPIREAAVTPVLGYRLQGIRPLEANWKRMTEEFANALPLIDEVTIFESGLTIYFNIRVMPDTSLADARTVADEIVVYFIERSNDVARDYDLQIVVSYGDIAEIIAYNEAAVIAHTADFLLDLTEEILTFAENYPTFPNIIRAQENIFLLNDMFGDVLGAELIANLTARVDVLDAMTLDDYEALANANQGLAPTAQVNRHVPRSNISAFPNWGRWINESNNIRWN